MAHFFGDTESATEDVVTNDGADIRDGGKAA